MLRCVIRNTNAVQDMGQALQHTDIVVVKYRVFSDSDRASWPVAFDVIALRSYLSLRATLKCDGAKTPLTLQPSHHTSDTGSFSYILPGVPRIAVILPLRLPQTLNDWRRG